MSQRVGKNISKRFVCWYDYPGRSKECFDELTGEWESIQEEDDLALVRVRSRGCKRKAEHTTGYKDTHEGTWPELEFREDHGRVRKVQKTKRRCLAGSEEVRDTIRLEDFYKEGAGEGWFGKSLYLCWLSEAILYRKPALNLQATDNLIRFQNHYLELYIEDGKIVIQPEPWSPHNRKIKAIYDEHRAAIHLAAVNHHKFAQSYIRNWKQLKIKTPKELRRKAVVCSCVSCNRINNGAINEEPDSD